MFLFSCFFVFYSVMLPIKMYGLKKNIDNEF